MSPSQFIYLCRLAVNFSDRYPLDPPEVSPLVYSRLTHLLLDSNADACRCAAPVLCKARSSFLPIPDDIC